MKSIRFAIGLAFVFLSPATMFSAGAEGLAQLEKLEAQYEGARDLARQPIRDLNRNYLKALERLLKTESDAGRLDSSLQIKTEIEAFGTGEEFDTDAFGERGTENEALENLRSVYFAQRNKIEEELAVPYEKLRTQYVGRLQKFIEQQTTKQDFEAAVAAKARREELLAIADGTVGNFTAVLHFVSKGDVEIELDGDDVRFSNESDDDEYIMGTTRELTFRSDSILLFKIRSHANFRAFVGALENEDGSLSMPFNREDYRVISERMFRSEVDAEEIGNLDSVPEQGVIDRYMPPMWEKAEIADSTKAASEWVRPPLKNEWNYFAILIDRKESGSGD